MIHFPKNGGGRIRTKASKNIKWITVGELSSKMDHWNQILIDLDAENGIVYLLIFPKEGSKINFGGNL